MSKRQYATTTDLPKEQQDDNPDDVMFSSLYGVRVIELNRPKKLNSLDGSMCRKILSVWLKLKLELSRMTCMVMSSRVAT